MIKNLSISLTQIAPPSLSQTCVHCGNPVLGRALSQFCCSGCETVYSYILSLEGQQVENYFKLKDKVRSPRKAVPVSDLQERFGYLDDPEFLKQYAWQTPEGRWMDFYVEGVHCAACVWLTEKIAVIVEHVSFIRLNLGNSVATVRLAEHGSFSSVAHELQRMGYRPHPIKRGDQGNLQSRENQISENRISENRISMIRIGIAGASAGNIMLLAISLYAGAKGVMADRFRWVSFGLFLPVLLYSAVPFYKSAWAAICSREISIDIPVVFGLLLGAGVSMLNLFSGDERVYFDSLSTLVFLLLSTRFLLQRAQQKACDSSRLLHFITPLPVRRWNSVQNAYEEVKLEQLALGDHVQILPGEGIPVDGVILKGLSSLDCALLSGESDPQRVGVGDLVFAGTLNLDEPLEVRVTQAGRKTRVGRVLDSLERLLTQKAPITVFADRISRYFVAVTVLLSGLVFAWNFNGDWHEGLNRALAVAIVTCPCTFALITPVVLSLTLGRLARAGVLVKSPDVLEKLARVQSIFLDKTGTLTLGVLEIVHWDAPEELSAQILAIASPSTHPIAKAVVKYLQLKVLGAGFRELPKVLPKVLPSLLSELERQSTDLRIRAQVEGNWLELRRSENACPATEISILKNDVCVGRAILADPVRPESKAAVHLLRSLDLNLWILSGDHHAAVEQVGRGVGIGPQNLISEASPERKAKVIEDHPHALMLGDGANDSLALAQADVGVAFQGGVEISLRAAEVYLRTPGVQSLYELLVIARETLRVVQRNFGFSILYNLVAGGFALAGKIDPLFAAILMPLSALTVFLSAITGTFKMNQAFRRLGL